MTLLTTALVAAPLHGRLAPGPDPVLLRRLLAADRVRAAGAVVALAGASSARSRSAGGRTGGESWMNGW